MKIRNMLNLAVAIWFASAISSLACPLYIKEEKIVHTQPCNDRQPDLFIEVQIWTTRKANGLTRFHFKNDQVYFEVWAKDQPTAIKKFRREFGKAAY